ncbi:NYN domain-containing protein [Actinosynnema sp. CA-299493]
MAVFLDFENLVLGAANELEGASEAVPTDALAWLCRGFGNASIRRAYADWANPRFGTYQNALAMNGVDLVQIGRWGGAGQHKNAADIRLAVDAMETLITHPGVGVFVLATGDSDYTPLVTRLREHGKQVIGVGTQASASKRLVSVCTQYRYWGSLVAEVDPTAKPKTVATSDIAEAEQLPIRAFNAISSDTPTASALKSKMRALDPSFDQVTYGCRTFRDFLGKFPHRVRQVGDSGRDKTYAIVE